MDYQLKQNACPTCLQQAASTEEDKIKCTYVGETSRSLFERSGEYVKDGTNSEEDSHIARHWIQCHNNLDQRPDFKFQVIRKHPDPLTRQIAEGVGIGLRGRLNMKQKWRENLLDRLTLAKTEKEKRWEIRKISEGSENEKQLQIKMIEKRELLKRKTNDAVPPVVSRDIMPVIISRKRSINSMET